MSDPVVEPAPVARADTDHRPGLDRDAVHGARSHRAGGLYPDPGTHGRHGARVCRAAGPLRSRHALPGASFPQDARRDDPVDGLRRGRIGGGAHPLPAAGQAVSLEGKRDRGHRDRTRHHRRRPDLRTAHAAAKADRLNAVTPSSAESLKISFTLWRNEIFQFLRKKWPHPWPHLRTYDCTLIRCFDRQQDSGAAMRAKDFLLPYEQGGKKASSSRYFGPSAIASKAVLSSSRTACAWLPLFSGVNGNAPTLGIGLPVLVPRARG